MEKNTNIWILGIIAVIAMIFLTTYVRNSTYGVTSGPAMMGYGYAPFGFIGMILFMGLMIWLMMEFMDNSSNKHEFTVIEKPQDILKKRYVKGEISKKEYDIMKKELEK